MRQRQLEILLERVRPFPSPKAEMEQYSLPAPAAAALLHFAHLRGELRGAVYDLGCGTGILAIGAGLLGARRAVGVDRDPEALAVARENAGALGAGVEWVEADVASLDPAAHRADTVLMNPPFGAQVKGADRPFLRKALELAPVAYGFGNRGSAEFVKRFISPARLTATMSLDIPLKRTFSWHRKVVRAQEIELYRMER
ncbi:MAG: METTL5 family protein [Halobacteria archaeon]